MTKVLTTVNGYLVETTDKKKVTQLADHIDKDPRFNVTEIRLSWSTDQGVIFIYPVDTKATKEDLNKIIEDYGKLPD